MKSNNWTRDQLRLAVELYIVTPFGKIHSKNPEIIKLAHRIGRTPGAVALKMVNFASLDETIDQSGMKNSSKLDKEIWNEFIGQISDSKIDNPNEEAGFSELNQSEYIYDLSRHGSDVIVYGKSRRGQDFFRRMILASYDTRCAITGIENESLLVASHIIPWSKDHDQRMNPCNGICLSALHDKAFDCGLIAISNKFKVLYSNSLSDFTLNLLKYKSNENIKMPSRFIPNIDLLDRHREYFSQSHTYR